MIYQSAFAPGQRVALDATARNPLLEDLRQTVPHAYTAAMAESGGKPPTLFAAGDLPLFTASGYNPEVLLDLPWQARHAAAAEPDRAKFAAMFEEYAGESGALAAVLEHGEDTQNLEYRRRVAAWARDARRSAAQ